VARVVGRISVENAESLYFYAQPVLEVDPGQVAPVAQSSSAFLRGCREEVYHLGRATLQEATVESSITGRNSPLPNSAIGPAISR
jgi:hypothetical protein